MKELIEVIATALVDRPDQVQVHEKVEKDRKVYQLSVAKEEMGKVIGKGGRVAKAMRTVVSAAAAKEGTRVTLEIL
mgnify:CR=1 FL=1